MIGFRVGVFELSRLVSVCTTRAGRSTYACIWRKPRAAAFRPAVPSPRRACVQSTRAGTAASTTGCLGRGEPRGRRRPATGPQRFLRGNARVSIPRAADRYTSLLSTLTCIIRIRVRVWRGRSKYCMCTYTRRRRISCLRHAERSILCVFYPAASATAHGQPYATGNARAATAPTFIVIVYDL